MKIWRTVQTIPAYLVKDFGDAGLYEEHFGKVIDKDDLRVCINLVSGNQVLLDSKLRIVIGAEGDLEIEALVKVAVK